MPITSAQRRAASYTGHITLMPGGRWTGYLTDRMGNSLVLEGERSSIASVERLDLIATVGLTAEEKRLKREGKS